MLEKLVSLLVGLGVPGFILFVLATSSGLAGAAAITSALVALGPGGMVGGLVTAGVLAIISAAVTAYGFKTVLKAVIRGFLKKGTSKADLINALGRVEVLLSGETYRDLVREVEGA